MKTTNNFQNSDLDSYKAGIQEILNGLAGWGTVGLRINGVNYDFVPLLSKENLHKKGSELEGKAREELLSLCEHGVTEDDIYNSIPFDNALPPKVLFCRKTNKK